MSVWTDTDIKQILVFSEDRWNDDNNKLLIKNGSEACLTPMGYDLRVGEFGKKLVQKRSLVDIAGDKSVQIKPGDTALIATLESIKMPKNGMISAIILSKVSQVARGLSNVSTKIDPGWSEGELLVPVQNLSRETIQLKYGEKFCTVVFLQNKSTPSSLYSISSSRKKFFKLLAQTRKESRKKDVISALFSLFIIVIFSGTGYFLFRETAGFPSMIAIGTAVERISSKFIADWLGRTSM